MTRSLLCTSVRTSFRTGRKLPSSSLSRRLSARRIIRADMAGQYGESFEDISKHLTDLFTYKSVKTVLAQLQETDPTAYRWLYEYTLNHRPSQSHLYCKTLVKEKRELGERVMETRKVLVEEWFKRVKSDDVVEYVSASNLKVLQESLTDSVNFVYTAKPRPELEE